MSPFILCCLLLATAVAASPHARDVPDLDEGEDVAEGAREIAEEVAEVVEEMKEALEDAREADADVDKRSAEDSSSITRQRRGKICLKWGADA